MNTSFSTQLMHEVVCLNDAASIVTTSFKLQESLSYLDLQLSERTLAMRRKGYDRTFTWPSFFQTTFFSTEETLRNSLVPERTLLYYLHLDEPERRENSNLSIGYSRYSPNDGFISFQVEVGISSLFYIDLVGHLMETAYDRTNDKVRLLNWIADLGEVNDLQTYDLREDIELYFLNHLFLECKDSNFVTKCVLKITEFTALVEMEQPEMLEHFLYHANKSDYDMNDMWMNKRLANKCIRDTSFRSFRSILKYEDKPFYNEAHFKYYENSARRNRTVHATRNTEWKMSKERHYRLLQILFFFDQRDGVFEIQIALTHKPPAPLEFSEALGLIWNTIPDAFVTLQEMQDGYGFERTSNEISDVHKYYEKAICQTVSSHEPRSLLHYCKTFIRHILSENDVWLPEGIKELDLPTILQDYLNLKFLNLQYTFTFTVSLIFLAVLGQTSGNFIVLLRTSNKSKHETTETF